MVSITIHYQGNLHCQAKHGPSGSIVETDAPVDNMGKGEAFSPTDLLATSLATCVVTTMAIMADRIGFDMSGVTAQIEKKMSSDLPRRIVSLPLAISIPNTPAPEDKIKLQQAAHACPVARSLHPDIEKTIAFHWGVSLQDNQAKL